MNAERSVDEFLDTLYLLRPVDATFIGVHAQDHRLPDWSPAGHERAVGAWRSVATRLRSAAVPSPAFDGWHDIDRAVALSHAELTLAELGTRHFTRGNPSLAAGEAAFAIIGLITRDFLPAAQRASWLVQRLRALPAFLAGASASLTEAPVPATWLARALRESDATERLLTEGLPIWCRAMGLEADRAQAVVDAGQLAAGAVSGFSATLSTATVSSDEAPSAGPEHLSVCLSRGHWIDTPVEVLLNEATAQFADARATLDRMIRDAGTTTMADVTERLAQRRPTPGEYLGSFRRVWDECRTLAEDLQLVTWPDFPIRYVPIPEWTRMAAPSLYYLYYRSPAPRDAVVPHDYVVAPLDGLDATGQHKLLTAWNDSVIKLNHVVHHGALGHHVQNWFAARSPSRIGQIAAADCASRIAMLQGGTMAEGWACYATDLMDDAGFLTADERIAEQHTRLRLLGRARVDLGFHGNTLSFDQALRLYVDDVGMTPEAARGELVKNSMFPGTAVMYWLGTRGIHELRQRMARRQGGAFTLRDFHDRFLAYGSLPVPLISRLMQEGM